MVMVLRHIYLRFKGGRHLPDAAPLFVLIVVGGLLLSLTGCQGNETEGTAEEKAYDQLQRKGRWSEIIKKNNDTPAQSLACKKVVALAQWRLNGDNNLNFCLEDSHDVLTSQTAALMMSDVYIQLGMVAMAQRAAFEGMVNVPDVRRNERALRRLTETAIITRQYDLALKYIAIVEEHFSSGDWVKRMRDLALHPEHIRQYPTLNKLRENYEKMDDQFFM